MARLFTPLRCWYWILKARLYVWRHDLKPNQPLESTMALSNENAALLEQLTKQLLEIQTDVLTVYVQERDSSGCDQVALAQSMADLQVGLWQAQKALIEIRGTL